MQVFKDLLLNVFFISFLPVIFMCIWGEKVNNVKDRTRALLLALMPALSSVLCMTFPVQFPEDYLFDLRQLPLIFGCLYLGYKKILPAMAIVLAYRFFLGGGEGFYVYLSIHTTIFLIVPLMKTSYLKLSFSKRYLVTSSLTVFFSVMVLALSKIIASVPLIYGDFAYIFIGVQLLGALVVTSILNYIERNMQLRDELFKAAKMKLIGEMSASVSHEIRNPLTASRGFLQMLLNPSLEEYERKRYISIAIQELDRAKDIIDDYLVLANPFPDDREEINLKDEVQWAKEVLLPYSNMYNVEIKLHAADSIFYVCEKKKIRQVFINLGKNAIEAMPGGGTLFIELSRNNNNIEIGFQDNGAGMDDEQIAKLGEPYFTTKNSGTGLGMMIVWRIVQSMGGKIEVSSTLGEGTDIKIFLPNPTV